MKDQTVWPRVKLNRFASAFDDLMAAIENNMTDGQAISGVGTFGIGGAIGPGNAANAGYQGRPGTMTWSCHFLKHSDTDGLIVAANLTEQKLYKLFITKGINVTEARQLATMVIEAIMDTTDAL